MARDHAKVRAFRAMVGYAAIYAYAQSWRGGFEPPPYDKLHPDLKHAFELAAVNGESGPERQQFFVEVLKPLGWVTQPQFDAEKKYCPLMNVRSTELRHREPWNLFALAVGWSHGLL